MSRIYRRTRRGHANSLRHQPALALRSPIAAHTAWPRQLIATSPPPPPREACAGRTRRGHADSLRHDSTHHPTLDGRRRTRRGHADSLRPRKCAMPRLKSVGAHGVATPTYCDRVAVSAHDGDDLGAHGVATPTHCDVLLPHHDCGYFVAHTAWPRRLIATLTARELLRFPSEAHTAWPRRLIATNTCCRKTGRADRRTRRGHADSLRRQLH